MTAEDLRNQLILYLQNKIHEEYDIRHDKNNQIFSYASKGIEKDIDALPEITNSLNEIAHSEQRSTSFHELLKFLEELNLSK
ncbi:hypothetical protein ADIAL_1898 [Alkalibacterium sp. AK22]|uniref:hypothetical protein n=1 Tax=Alkalibacterium sp. AK22 TaxID=1229520 RepID=UPI000449B015|nr:hypothetical protein [Alkalibacterium sp. AK22]EXJ22644.1 hypothetical protein ADIAL_1898 [Alkalibacterium sp. AK22]